MKSYTPSHTFMRKQDGFGHVELLAAIVFVFVLGFFGVRVFRASHAATTSTLFGTTISSSTDLAQKTSYFGHMAIVRVYYPGLPPANAWTTGLAGANKSAAIVSFKALPSTILSGADDAALTTFFDTAPTTYPIYYSYYHEPEDNIADGQFTASDYKAAWAHVVALANKAHNSELHSTLILMAYTLLPASHRTWTNYLPSGNIISTLGWDDYPSGGEGLPNADYLQQAVTTSKQAGLPFGFAEFGTVTTSNRAAWLTSVGNYIKNSGALFGTLYDSSNNGGLGGSGTFVVSDSSSISAWKSIVQSSTETATPPKPASTTPTVSITSPKSGATVKGVVTFAVTASSNVKNSNLVWDGKNIIRAATAKNTYGWGSRWNSTQATNGQHTITITVYNAAGQSASASITVDVKN
jgi:hypothetical protein